MMLAHLLFVEPPARVLLAGCGGGALARWFNARLPQTHGVAVEHSTKVIELALEVFDFPGTDTGWQIKHADVRDFLANQNEQFDFILFDLDEQGNTPGWLQEPAFLSRCQQCLTPSGVLTINVLAHDAQALVKTLWPLRQVFPDLTCCLSNQQNSNIMILAFNSRPDTHSGSGSDPQSDIGQLERQAEQARQRYDIEFDVFYQQLLKDNPPGSGIF